MSAPMSAKELFLAAHELPPAERAAFLDAQCGDDAALRGAAEELLAAADRAGEFLSGPTLPPAPGTTTSTVARPARELRRIGPYKLLQELGEGGFGTVWLAEQEHPVRRRVALKLIKLGMDTRQVIARFEAERQALAMMDHPNIARVYDAGAAENGRPYFVMELVKGVPITQFCDQHHLDIRQRLDLFVQVCQAIQHAHQKGIIHRDLKPSNVLVSLADDKRLVKVIDFGIAKATQARLTEKTVFTELRQMIGTPEYMSPEQAQMSGLDVDTRSDIYSLGVILYELLTGATPFDAKELRSKAYAEMQRVIREEDPPKPSTRLSTMESLPSVAAARHTEPAKLSRTVRGELDWIVMKCLEKDRARRYDTANGLAADVMHYLANEPVVAGPVSTAYRVQKFVRRNRTAVIVSIAILGLLLAGITGTTIGLIGQARQRRIAEQQRGEAERQATEAQRQAAIAEAVSQFQSDMLASADPDRLLGEKVMVVQVINAAVRELDAGKLKDQPLVEAGVRTTIGLTLQGLGRYDAAAPNLRKALELRRAVLGANHPAVAAAMADLGLLNDAQGKAAEAETLLRQALTVRRAALPPDHPEVARGLNDLAAILMAQGKFDEAEHMSREALAIRRKASPPNEREIATTVNNLARLVQEQGRFAEAEPLLREALDICRRSFPAGHPTIGSSVNNLAMLLMVTGRFAEAEPLFREALEIRRQSLPAAHPVLAAALNNLGGVLKNQGKLAEAETFYREALQINRNALPPGHPHTAATINNLARLLQAEGKLAEAEPLMREALEMRRKTLPPGHPDTAQSVNNLAVLLQARGDLAGAESLAREALDLRRKALPAGHADIAQSLVSLASILSAQQHHAEAEPLYGEAIAINDAAFGNQSLQSANARLAHGNALVALGRYRDAETDLLAAQQVFSTAPRATPAHQRQAEEALVRLYTAWDKAEPDKGHAADAQRWRSTITTKPATLPATTPATTEAVAR
jgi:serine/threonine protein kinase/tetratricopeptide (TPR) repeat protein